MTGLEAALLGLIQGLTEFLPVSSSGHIELGKALLGVELKDPLVFSIVVHCATALSTIVVFYKYILELTLDLLRFKWNAGTKYVSLIVLSMIPVGLVGYLFEDTIDGFFSGNILLVGLMLLVTGVLLYTTILVKQKDNVLNFKRAFIIGIAQMVAILPGISRSGSTIATALLLGVKKEEAARFSFLMVLPPILGATLLKFKDFMEVSDVATAEVNNSGLAIGFFTAFIAGLLACKLMIKLVKSSKLQYFAIYCFVVGAIAILWNIFA
ncbi:MAG: undecaprenyl-diphosphatase [Flavobacteriales bacterium]|jgi:undecaprenyl-diphosphatase